MSKRAAKFVSAIFASLLAGLPFATISHGAPETADSCLSEPKGALPRGGHWYYRIDRATKRQCWYIRDAGGNVSRAAPDTSPPSDKPVSPPPKEAGRQRSIDNARAELPLPQTRVEQDPGGFAGQRAAAIAVDAARMQNAERPNTDGIDTQRSVVASRWPELAAARSAAGPAPSMNQAADGPRRTAEAAPPPAIAPVTQPAAEATDARSYGSVQMLLIAIVGALSVASLIASAIIRIGGRRRAGRLNANRRVNWGTARTARPSLAEEARGGGSMREMARLPEDSLPRARHAADDPNAGIETMLTRLARSN